MNWKIASAVTTLFIGSVLLIGQKSDDKNPRVPCQQPLTYQIADLDPRFDMDKKTIRKIMQNVEGLWKTALNKEVLQYSEDGIVKIHLVYNSSQQRTDEEQQMAKRIERIKLQILSEKNDIKSLRKSYQHKLKSYRQTMDIYNETVSRINNEMASLDNEDIKEKLSSLKTTANRKLKNAKFMRSRLNDNIEQLNDFVKSSKKVITEYNNKFSKSHEFNEGKFIRKDGEQRIEIYEFGNNAELKAVLAHEVGHALGISHVENPESIMYYMMGRQNIFNLELTKKDKVALQTVCDN